MKIYDVIQVETMWRVNAVGDVDRGLTSHVSKHEAMMYAIELAKANRPAKIVVRQKSGVIDTEFTYDVQKPAEAPVIKS
jgi:hypothetical protein